MNLVPKNSTNDDRHDHLQTPKTKDLTYAAESASWLHWDAMSPGGNWFVPDLVGSSSSFRPKTQRWPFFLVLLPAYFAGVGAHLIIWAHLSLIHWMSLPCLRDTISLLHNMRTCWLVQPYLIPYCLVDKAAFCCSEFAFFSHNSRQ